LKVVSGCEFARIADRRGDRAGARAVAAVRDVGAVRQAPPISWAPLLPQFAMIARPERAASTESRDVRLAIAPAE
jgi:hypothetical protein